MTKEIQPARSVLTELKQRFRDTRQGQDEFIYLLTDETFGAVLRMESGQ